MEECVKLELLQQQEYMPVGSSAVRKTNVRIIAATHRDLRQAVGQGHFREDLYYRLHVMQVHLPALRERADDIGPLAAHFLHLAAQRGLPLKTLDDEALAALLPLQRKDFAEILDAMDGLPVTIRLLDPPLHEFLPDRTELAVKVALAEAAGQSGPQVDADRKVLAAVERLHESNPMLGLRGVRLGLLTPGLFALQVRAIAEAMSDQIAAGKNPKVEIMVPLVGSVMELHLVRDETERILTEVGAERDVTLTVPVGTMIELPRAALTAHRIADAADFFSFGTNDLTQTTWGFSRDDVESTVFAAYLEKGVFTISPFETIDADGIGRLVEIAAEEGRKTKPDLKLGVCGEHGGDPESIHFFHRTGLDYVSCSPFRLPVARLEAGRAAVG